MRFSFRPLIPIILITAAFTPSATAATLHVPADHPTIQTCIDAAVSGQDECVVGPGTYNELINFLGKAITLRSSHGPAVTTIDGTGLNGSVVQIKNQMAETVFAGFTVTGGNGLLLNGYRRGGGLYASQANPLVANSVFVSNDAQSGGGIHCDGKLSLSMCRISRNTATYGAGLFIQGSESQLSDCIIDENIASSAGGGLYNQQTEQTLQRCQFLKNHALYGGGIRNAYSIVTTLESDFVSNTAGRQGGAIANGDANSIEVTGSNQTSRAMTFDIYDIQGGRFTSNQVFGNDGLSNGGAIYYRGSHDMPINNVIFEFNSARYGGAVFDDWGTVVMRGCQFEWNNAERDGGAVAGGKRIESSAFLNNSAVDRGGALFGHPVVADSLFRGNTAEFGGAVHGTAGSVRSQFIGNSAWTSGGAMYNAGAESCQFHDNWAGTSGGAIHTSDSTRVLNSLFTANASHYGGAICNASGASVYSSTFVENFAHVSGGAISNVGCQQTPTGLRVVNSILWGNLALVDGSQIRIDLEAFNATVSESDIEESGGSSNWDSSVGADDGGNIDLDPIFVRMPDDGGDGWGDNSATVGFDEGLNDDPGDLRLSPGSPCINAGNSAWVASIPKDLDGHARVLCGRVDMGAYESGIGDYDCNQSVNLADLSAWPDCMTDPAPSSLPHRQPGSRFPDPESRTFPPDCSSFDFNADGHVDLNDLAQFMLAVTVP